MTKRIVLDENLSEKHELRVLGALVADVFLTGFWLRARYFIFLIRYGFDLLKREKAKANQSSLFLVWWIWAPGHVVRWGFRVG